MEEKEKDSQQQQQEKLVEIIDVNKKFEDLKQNYVSKEEYNKLANSYNEVVNNAFDGIQKKEEPKDETPKRTWKECWQRLFKPDHKLNNMEFWERTLEYRDKTIEEKDYDVFVAKNANLTPTQESIDAAARVADVVQDCLEKCGGDSITFNQLLDRRVIDVNLPGTFKR